MTHARKLRAYPAERNKALCGHTLNWKSDTSADPAKVDCPTCKAKLLEARRQAGK